MSLARLSINLKLLFLSALPLLLLILFLSREGENLYSIQKNSYQTKVIVELALTLENIAHQHALERGLTAGFLGLNDTKGKHKIFNQRKKSDQSVDDLEDFFNTRQSDLKNININANVEKLTYLLEQKKLVRSKIDQLASDHNAFNYYSSVNKKIIDTIDLLIVFVGDNTLHGELNSMVEMVRLKERAGKIRGALNEVYSKGTATVGAYTRIYTLIKDFDKTLELLINNRKFHTKQALTELSKTPTFTQIITIQNDFLNQSNQLNKVRSPVPEKWFALATQRVKAINTIIYQQELYILTESQQIFDKSRRYLIVGSIIMLAVISALITLSYCVALNISSRIRNINSQLTHSINNNDLTIKVDDDGNDEVTHIAKGINRYISRIKDVVNNIEETSLEQEYLANHDPLTKLANRSLLFSRLANLTEQLYRYDRHHAILYIDLDFFKKINDEYGHAVGDKVLFEFAKRLVRKVRKSDTIARLGGDEFAIILEEITSENAYLIAQKLLEDMKTPLMIDNVTINISISIGMTFFPNEESQDPTVLLKQADQALYNAKKSGRQQYRCFDKALQIAHEESTQLENDLKDAIKNQEIFPHFQPQYCLRTQKIVGLEALARWQHLEKGFISPGLFIPSAEKLSLITLLTESIMTKAGENFVSFLKIDPSLKIAINISGSDCCNPYISYLTKKMIEENQLRPEQIELEVTESVLIEQAESATDMLTALNDLGVSIAIDDFGTGYSSLSYLTSLPIDVLKIDMSFVQGIGTNLQQEIVIKVIVDLAKRLSLKVLAEGIETQAQADFLIQSGCDYGQGYFYSKPCSPDGIIKLLKLNQI
jgi:diguanylate cyclase (GGDEF)-like protein